MATMVWLPATQPVTASEPATESETLPSMLQLAVTRSMAQDVAPEYRIDPDGRGVNPRHGLTLTYTPEGALIESRHGSLALRLQSFGRGDGEPVRRTTPRVDGVWVEYDRGAGLSEWFVNSPQGVEHGWMLEERPPGRGPLMLELDTERPPDRKGYGRFTWSGMTYHGLVAMDAGGRTLPSQWAVDGIHVHIEIDDSAAVYPVVIDPWIQQAKLVASDGGRDVFGSSVDLSDDGSIALVGALEADVGSNSRQGAAYVYTRAGEEWNEQDKLTAADGAGNDRFGSSVALSDDGSTALVGAPRADVGVDDEGAAYVFTRTGEIWNEQDKLTASDGAENEFFGDSVALSDDGGIALVGAPRAEVSGTFRQGAAYVFAHAGDEWTEQGKLTAPDGAERDEFGRWVALSDDGSTALLGAPLADVGDNVNQGAAYVFTHSGEAWNEQDVLTAHDGAADDLFGFSVALAGDTALVGAAIADVDGHTDQGAAYVFTRNSEAWNEQDKLTVPDGAAGDEFGISVALADDGSTALVGADRVDVGDNTDQGAAYVFTRNGDAWTEQDKLIATDGATGDSFGFRTSLSGDGVTALVGAWLADGIVIQQGAAYVFVDRGPEFATIQGTVQGLGHCAADPGLVSGAEVVIQGQSETFAVIPDDNTGIYQLALDVAEGPVDITASAPGHVPQTVTGVELAAGETITQDFDLLLEAPCATRAPTSFSSELDPGQVTTETLTLGNLDGAAELEWTISTVEPRVAHGESPARDVRANSTEPSYVDVRMPAGSTTQTVTDLASVLDETPHRIPPIQSIGDAVDCENEPHLVVHDDGGVENGYRDPFVGNNTPAFVDRFTVVPGASIDAVCLAFLSTDPNQTSLNFEIVVFDDDCDLFDDPCPGTELGSLPFFVEDIPVISPPIPADLQPTWFSFDISSLDIVVHAGSVFIGARWPGGPSARFFIAADESSGDPDRPVGFAGGYQFESDGDWDLLEDEHEEYRSLLVRAIENLRGCLEPAAVPWLSVAPASGTASVGGTSEVDVSIDTAGLDVGDYEASVCISSNDPVNPLIVVPIHLRVRGAELTFDPASLDLGEVPAGTTSEPQSLVLRNVGPLDTTGLQLQVLDDDFDVDASDCGTTLPAGGECSVSVTFTPSALGPTEAALEANADFGVVATVGLTGNGTTEIEAFVPMALTVDPEEIISNGNGVFEPGELATVAPSWHNGGLFAQFIEGTASNLTGPGGPTYSLATADADYGEVESGQMSSCLSSELCYEIDIGPAGVSRPATHWMATFDETLSDETTKTWALHIGESFTDVPSSNLFYQFIETLLHHDVTGGCTATEYCPTASNTRGQMAVFLLRAVEEDLDYAPPACVEGEERFADVRFDNTFCPWIEELAERGITSGCGGDNYCPNNTVTRSQMAIFLLKAFEGAGFTPPECSGEFSDVDCPSAFADWIEELAARGVTGGCGANPPAYCPADPVTRAQMAAFVTRTFGFTLYGP